MSDVLWQSVLGEIEVTVSKASYVTWFRNTSLLENNDGNITIGVPNIFTKRQLEDKYHPLILKVLEKNGQKIESVSYQIKNSGSSQQTSTATATKTKTPPAAVPRPQKANGKSLNKRYTFDNFIVGSSNEVAHAAAQSIAKSPGGKYNPLFVYGGVGLGKTHLIQAIGNEVCRQRPQAQVEYITCEAFTTEFISSILRKRNFSNRYRSADVFIVDDIQFIAGKDKTQEELFHTFNSLHQANKQIVLSSDKPPKAIPTLEERLRSRFEWGMTVDISTPDFETRVAIVQSKADDYGIDIDSKVAEYLASHYQSNIRELEGALTKLLAHCEMRHMQPTIDSVEQLLRPDTSHQKHLTPRSVVDKTARFFNLTKDEITGPKRDKEIVEPRQIAMYLLRSELHLSFPQIARFVGRKDHTTAIHSVSKIEASIGNDHYLRQKIYELKEKLYV